MTPYTTLQWDERCPSFDLNDLTVRQVRPLQAQNIEYSEMNDWYCKTLGCGEEAFKALKRLRFIRYQACSSVQINYHLAVDIMTADTIVYFPPGSASMAVAFGALACDEPVLDGNHLRKLDFEPLQIKPDDAGFLSAMTGIFQQIPSSAQAF